ncbi:outer membrane protein [Phreatobacter stygius]|uniref:Porin family protein n=1 Tax=Phreatobacter stygius TaxID=1940610 RepID=A0A4D7B640_9HYPH|nr:outer membrane protein [Phreatobacter stygius]QCI63457.1 porin family protein [Phreatobacter stygius]
MKRSVLAAVLAVSATGVQAADLGAQRIAVPSAILATGHDWTGFYAGLHAGYGWGNTRFDPLANVPDTRSQGALIGGQFGWNYQVGQFVLGLEGTLAWASLSGSVSDPSGSGSVLHSKVNWIATLGPRLGFAFDRALIYAKGGLAIAGLETRIVNPLAGSASGSHAQGGWFVGGGVEYALTPNWSVKAEYNYINLGTGVALLDAGGGFAQGFRTNRNIHTITLGFNYLFPVSRQAAIRSASLDAAGGFNWTGFYLGAHAGYGWGSTTFDAALGPLGPNHSHDGVLLGGQFGWNYQINRVVLGLEATATWAGLSGSTTALGNTFRTRVNWLATMGPRVGFTVFDRALIYGKGGVAFAGFETGAEIAGSGDRLSSARIGWFVGGGAEYAFAPNWSAKVEYNYHNFSSGSWLASAGPFVVGLRTKEDVHSVTVGVNYLFTTGPGAVVARY